MAPGNKRERTRRALIEAALAVAERHGFVGASLDEIAAQAAMTKGAIYSNFAGKADLMFAAAESRGLRLEPVYVAGGTLEDQFDALAEALLRMLPKTGPLARLHAEFQAYLAVEPALRQRAGAFYAQAFDRMSKAIEDAYGPQLRLPAASLVMAAQALCTGFVQQHQLTPGAVSEAVVRNAFGALARGALR